MAQADEATRSGQHWTRQDALQQPLRQFMLQHLPVQSLVALQGTCRSVTFSACSIAQCSQCQAMSQRPDLLDNCTSHLGRQLQMATLMMISCASVQTGRLMHQHHA